MNTPANNPAISPQAAKAVASSRLLSLDALRGFDMFWIVGADSLGHALAHFQGGPVIATVARQLDHVEWAGFRFYDLIFPLFAFMIGVALTFSLGKLRGTAGDRSAALRRLFTRAGLLYLLGLFYYGGFATPFEHIRYVGVLHRLAIAYLGAGLLFLYLKPKGLVAAAAGILLGYWALMAWTPFKDVHLDPARLAVRAEAQSLPEIATALRTSRNVSTDTNRAAWAYAKEIHARTTNYVRGHYEPGYNLANHWDFQFLPGKKWDGFYDPEGLISNLAAIASALLGVLAGLWIRRTDVAPGPKVSALVVMGIALVVLGFIWGLSFPVVKKLWTSSFVLVAGGYSALLLAGFYQVIDVWRIRAWAQPFVWIGANPLAIYMASNLINFDAISARLVGGAIEHGLNRAWTGLGEVVLALAGIGLSLWFCRFLYVRNIFLRL